MAVIGGPQAEAPTVRRHSMIGQLAGDRSGRGNGRCQTDDLALSHPADKEDRMIYTRPVLVDKTVGKRVSKDGVGSAAVTTSCDRQACNELPSVPIYGGARRGALTDRPRLNEE